MDWIKNMNAAVQYIETRLTGEIDYQHVARLADCSAYHFQRVFSYMAGVTLAEYIRRRRLTLAAFELQQGLGKVIDIALKYGYDSPTAFARAFSALHGITPSEAKQGGQCFTAYPPLSFQITIKGVAAMNYRIETKESFRVVGYKLETTMENEAGLREIPVFWSEIASTGKVPQVCALMNSEPLGLMGISVGDWYGEENRFDYYAAVASTQPVPEGMAEYQIPASQWAIFDCLGPMPTAVQELQRRIVSEWLPGSGYEYGNAPDIELYDDGDNQAADYHCQVWLPIRKK